MFLTHLHSFLGWSLLILLFLSVITAIAKSMKSGDFKTSDKILFLGTMILGHLQFVMGIIVYFSSNKVIFSKQIMSEPIVRFFVLEHPLLMILGLLLMTIGYVKSKKAQSDKSKFKKIYIFYLIALILILARFPWAYLTSIGTGWF